MEVQISINFKPIYQCSRENNVILVCAYESHIKILKWIWNWEWWFLGIRLRRKEVIIVNRTRKMEKFVIDPSVCKFDCLCKDNKTRKNIWCVGYSYEVVWRKWKIKESKVVTFEKTIWEYANEWWWNNWRILLLVVLSNQMKSRGEKTFVLQNSKRL